MDVHSIRHVLSGSAQERHRGTTEIIGIISDSVGDLLDKGEPYVDEEDLRDHFLQMIENVESMESMYAEAEGRKKAMAAILSKASELASLEDSTNVDLVGEYTNAVPGLIETAKHSDSCQQYFQWLPAKKNFLTGAEVDDDDEEIVVRSGAPEGVLKCCITLMDLKDPMKHPGCPHVYSKQGIFSLLKGKVKIACPVAGCAGVVTKKDLVPDLITAKKVARQIKLQSQVDTGASESLEMVE